MSVEDRKKLYVIFKSVTDCCRFVSPIAALLGKSDGKHMVSLPFTYCARMSGTKLYYDNIGSNNCRYAVLGYKLEIISTN